MPYPCVVFSAGSLEPYLPTYTFLVDHPICTPAIAYYDASHPSMQLTTWDKADEIASAAGP